ncbi:FHA domain-containing protein [Giardia duodenalis]|uniref:FHA domain-containing protein n=1 Tax=Giardia intestinalis (strain ATCC 50803 / WB clone C6) TaxID=184922 RepID=A8BGL0_GIAIC|nr:FHA domain-containing protein [Giardia intestinalis]KAE8302159.1 FHA domain-containing protein [Giardia intestinalis]|eukprot:XP_001707206.1 Hypothetical protein GL50803_23017 [Giardia lamblia ATCC 50803]
MSAENGITAWVNSLRESTEKRFFLGHIKESANTDAEYDKPAAFRVCLFGRAHMADIHLADCYCSRQHALIYFNEGTPMIRDLDSRTGTTVNNIVLVGGRDYPLTHGDIISVVGQRFAFIYEEEKPQEHDVDRNLPVVSMATHSCPYCQKFIPEFSVELEALQQQTEKVLKELLAMEVSYRTSRIITEKLFEKIELVKHHHDAYHHELLVEAKERRIHELEATRVAGASVVMGRSRIVMDPDEDDGNDTDSLSKTHDDTEPELKRRGSLKVDDLAVSKAAEKQKKKVAFLQKSEHIGDTDKDTDKKSGILNSIMSSVAFWKKPLPTDKNKQPIASQASQEKSDSDYIDSRGGNDDQSDSYSYSYSSTGNSGNGDGNSSSSEDESSSDSDAGEERVELRSYNGPSEPKPGAKNEVIKPKGKAYGKDTPAPPRYEFDDESED